MKQPFRPDELPLKTLHWDRHIELIGQANYEIARFEGTLKAMVNPAILLSPLTTKEAVLSSKIEGTITTLQEVLKFEAMPDPKNPRSADIQEVLNYRRAINAAVQQLTKRPLSLNLIKELHDILLNSVRGEHNNRGHFRRSQNWIGLPGTPMEQAFYVPPEPIRLMELLDNWEKYIHVEERDRIVQLAVIHAQFEIIHPFMDGNGRIGRMVVPLFLKEKGLLSSPVFYLSEYLEEYRDEYYHHLRGISDHGQWDEWIGFFLRAFCEQARRNTTRADAIIDLYEQMKREIHKLRSSFALPTLDTLFMMPIFNTTHFTEYSTIPKASVHRIISMLERNKAISCIKKGKAHTPAVYKFTQLIDVTEHIVSSHRRNDKTPSSQK